MRKIIFSIVSFMFLFCGQEAVAQGNNKPSADQSTCVERPHHPLRDWWAKHRPHRPGK